MFGIGSRTFYAEWHGMLFNFEYKRDRDYFVAHSIDAKIVSAVNAYDKHKPSNKIMVRAFDALGANKDRKIRVKNWHGDKQRSI